MSLARVKTWIPGDVLTAADLNAEFDNQLDWINTNADGFLILDAPNGTQYKLEVTNNGALITTAV